MSSICISGPLNIFPPPLLLCPFSFCIVAQNAPSPSVLVLVLVERKLTQNLTDTEIEAAEEGEKRDH